MYEYTKGVREDLNGDGKYDTNDLWGMASDCSSAFLFLNSFGAKLADFDEDYKPVVTINTSHAIEVLEKIMQLYNDEETIIWSSKNGGWSVVNQMVTDGKICLIPANIYKFATYIQMEDDFGVLPIPKFDSEQEEYHHQVFTNACTALCIPTTNPDLERTGIITEYLAYLGTKHMVPAFYDNYLKGRVTRDTESEKSFDIIFSTKCYDLGYAYSWGLNTIVADIVRDNTGAASMVDKIMESSQKMADDTYNAFMNMFD